MSAAVAPTVSTNLAAANNPDSTSNSSPMDSKKNEGESMFITTYLVATIQYIQTSSSLWYLVWSLWDDFTSDGIDVALLFIGWSHHCSPTHIIPSHLISSSLQISIQDLLSLLC